MQPNFQICASRVAPKEAVFRPALTRNPFAGFLPEKHMARKSYSELLLDPRWQRKRLEILQRSNFTCEQCKSADKTLHVHHRIYRKGAMPWEYADSELQALCKDCHFIETRHRAALDEALAQLDTPVLEEVLGYVEAEALKSRVEGQLVIRSWFHAFGIVRAFNITNYDAAQQVFQASVISFDQLHDLSMIEPHADDGPVQ